MNAPASFNTLAFARRLEAAGMEMRLAEAIAEAMSEVVFETTATKGDLRELELRLASEIREVELRLAADARERELRLTTMSHDQELRQNTRLGATVAGATALTVAILGVLITLD